MSGSSRTASVNRCRMVTPGLTAWRIEPQLWQTTLTAWPKVRMAVAAPQLGQLTERTLTGRRAGGSATLPALERADVSQAERVEIHCLADVERRRLVAVVDGGEVSARGAEVDEGDVGLVPVFEGKLAFDAGVVRQRARDDGERRVVPDEPSPERSLRLRRNLEAAGEKGHGERILRIREPAISAAVQHDAPLVPAALFVLIDDAAGHDESLVAVATLRRQLNRRGVIGQVGDLPNLLHVDIGADDDRMAVLADGLDAARPSIDQRRAAVGTAGGTASHPRVIPEPRKGRSASRAVPRTGDRGDGR